MRDTALTAISEAQLKTGDRRTVLAIDQRITQQAVRWKLLLALVAIPVQP